MQHVRRRRLEANEEQDIGHRILALEQEVTDRLGKIPACARLLGARRGRAGRTRAAAVDHLSAAVGAVATMSRVPRGEAARIRALWSEAQDLRWRLAMSGTQVVYREAHRLGANPTLAHADLVQEGMIGLVEAAKRFEPGRDVRFATYARWWVRAHMTRAIDTARVVHLSAGACEQLRNLRKQIRARELCGRSCTAGDLAADVGLDVDRVRTLLGVGSGQSIDEVGEDGDPGSAMQLADERSPSPEQVAMDREEAERLRGALPGLPTRQREIVTRRYGQDARTLDEIARRLRLSRERVRQLERESIELLRDACKRARVRSAPRSRGGI